MAVRGVAAALCLAAVADAGTILGAAPEEQAKYKGATHVCPDGSGQVAASAINDNFCDCVDGSDEPGTGACAGQDATLFYCPNAGSTPKRVYASRVNDGICDCCDGSDEVAQPGRKPVTKCVDSCKELGAREKVEREAKAAALKTGIANKEEIQKQALKDRAEWTTELAQLESQLPALEKVADELKKAREAREALEKAAADAAKAEEEAANAAKAEEEEGANKEADKDAEDKAATEKTQGRKDEEAQAAEDGKEEKVVSEYSKWMEDAETQMTEEEKGEKKPKTSEYAKWMEGAEEAGAGKDDDQADAGAAAEAGHASEPAEAEAEQQAEEDAEEALKKAEKEKEDAAKKQVKDNKDLSGDLKKKLAAITDEHLGYASLMGTKLEKKIAEFKYKLNFFGKAEQDHTSLGTWSKWTGPKSGEFTGGATCWQGPARKLTVDFECGVEEDILDVSEPSRCVYAAVVAHPGACVESDLELLAKPPVLGPHDEL